MPIPEHYSPVKIPKPHLDKGNSGVPQPCVPPPTECHPGNFLEGVTVKERLQSHPS